MASFISFFLLFEWQKNMAEVFGWEYGGSVLWNYYGGIVLWLQGVPTFYLSPPAGREGTPIHSNHAGIPNMYMIGGHITVSVSANIGIFGVSCVCFALLLESPSKLYYSVSFGTG